MKLRRVLTSAESHFMATHTALLAWARGDGLTWLHIFKTVLAALLAMGLSMRLDLPSPRTAMVTVFIVMQPKTGMVLAKSFYRFAGTIIGAVVTIIITAVFGQVPELFLLAIAIWIGFCTIGAAMNRNFRSYGFVLSGYTTALIGIPALAHPDGVFLAATTRVSELSMGIVCSAIVSAIVLPQHVADTLRDVVRARYSRFTELVTETFSGERAPESATDFHARFAADVVALETLSSVAVFEDWGARRRAGCVARLNTEFMNVSTRFQALRQWLGWLRGRGSADVVIAIEACLRDVPPLLALPDNNPVGTAADAAHTEAQVQVFVAILPGRLSDTRQRLAHLPDDALLEFDTAAELLERFMVEMLAYTQTYASLASETDTREPTAARYISKTNYVSAAVAGVRAAAALLLSSALWYETAWPSGPGTVLNTAVNSALVSTMPQPTVGAWQMTGGTLVAAVIAPVMLFGVYPRIDGYVMLCLVLVPVLMFGVWTTTRPGGMGFGLGYCISFCVLAGPDNMMNYNVEGTLNDALGLVISMVIVTMACAVIFPTARPWLRKRLLRDLLDQVVGACTRRMTRARLILESQTRDIGHQLTALSIDDPEFQATAANWMFTVLATGHAVLELREEIATIPQACNDAASACRNAVDGIAVLFDSPRAAHLAAARGAVAHAVSVVRGAARCKRATREARAKFERMSGYLHFIRVTLAELPTPVHTDAPAWLQAFLARR
ncbi:FUSC family protein [Paraburkholderia sp. J11-2]|uniref:FUSC family protein n=1 Tax=Paraburkholderia sp. J11-2 TaxID=2805431 RepID=UPI002AB7ABBE|nr:FUSC family protein [Paraburkholderia sp. J11-2]